MLLDTRLGGVRRHWVNPPKDFAMRVPDVILNSIVFLGARDASGRHEWRGTAFVVGVPTSDGLGASTYLVTARHCAEGFGSGDFTIRVNDKQGGSKVIESAAGTPWWYHPTERYLVDAAVLPIDLDEETDYRQIPTAMFLTDEIVRTENIGPGDEVFYTGLFPKMAGKGRNYPVLRTGNVAMLPDEPIPNVESKGFRIDMEAYLIEARSLGGFSGSPVFVRKTVVVPVQEKKGGDPITMLGTGPFYLMGLMHGHWNIPAIDCNEPNPPSTNAVTGSTSIGIAVVVPAKKILEIINCPDLVADRAAKEKSWMERQGTTSTD